MKRVAIVTGTAVAILVAGASGAGAAWTATGGGSASASAATFKTPSLNTTSQQPPSSRTECSGPNGNRKITAKWTLPSGGQEPASYTLLVGGVADPVTIAGTATSATSTNTYSGNGKVITIRANLGAWNEVSNSVTVNC